MTTAQRDATSPLALLRDLFGDRLDGLAGGTVSGSIPLTALIVNRLIARKLATANLPIDRAEVDVHEANTFIVQLRLRAPLPPLRLEARIDEQPQLPGRPELGVHWALRGLGPLALLAGPVASYFKVLPPGIRLDGDRVWIDLFTILRSQGLADLVPFMSGIRVTTEPGRFVVGFELKR